MVPAVPGHPRDFPSHWRRWFLLSLAGDPSTFPRWLLVTPHQNLHPCGERSWKPGEVPSSPPKSGGGFFGLRLENPMEAHSKTWSRAPGAAPRLRGWAHPLLPNAAGRWKRKDMGRSRWLHPCWGESSFTESWPSPDFTSIPQG